MEVYLTQLKLNHRNRRMGFDADQTHRFLAKATNSNTYLWSHPSPGTLLIQSQTPLSPSSTEKAAKSIYTRLVNLTYQIGDRLEFAGIINPTKSKFTRGTRGKKIPVPADEVPEWLTNRLKGAATLDPPTTVETLSPSKGIRPDKSRLTIARVSIHGHMTVKDPDKLTGILAHGVGQGKRFGAGHIQTLKEDR